MKWSEFKAGEVPTKSQFKRGEMPLWCPEKIKNPASWSFMVAMAKKAFMAGKELGEQVGADKAYDNVTERYERHIRRANEMADVCASLAQEMLEAVGYGD